MVRLGLVGTGRIGQLHVETLLRSQIGQLVAVTDLHLDAARACAERYGVSQVAHDVADLLHQFTFTARAHIRNDLLLCCAVAHGKFHFNQFVIV